MSLRLVILFLLMLSACAEEKSREWDNPLDAEGTNWHPPVVFLDQPELLYIGDTLKLIASAEDQNGEVVRWLWDVDTLDRDLDTTSEAERFFTWKDSGQYYIRVRVEDDHGLTSEWAAVEAVVSWGKPELQKISDTVVSASSALSLKMQANDPNGKVEQFLIDTNMDKTWDDTVKNGEFSLKGVGFVQIAWAAQDDDDFLSMDTVEILFSRAPDSVKVLPKATWNNWSWKDSVGNVNLAVQGFDPDDVHDSLEIRLYGKSGENYTLLDSVRGVSRDTVEFNSADFAADSVWVFKLVLKDQLGDSVTKVDSIRTPGVPSRCSDVGGNLISDARDDQDYTCGVFGEQEWLTQNLNHRIEDSWCYEDDENNCDLYGRLYKWNTAECPAGWRIPTDDDWENLAKFVSLKFDQGSKSDDDWTDIGVRLKAKTGWMSDRNGSDDLGFKGLPGGIRLEDGSYSQSEKYSRWWSSTTADDTTTWVRYLYYNNQHFGRYNQNQGQALSVRCIRNGGAQ